MIKKSTEIIQAFPIKVTTYQGTPNGMDVFNSGYELVHALDECNVTFDFGTMGTVTVTASAGMDFAFDDKLVQTITADGNVIIS